MGKRLRTLFVVLAGVALIAGAYWLYLHFRPRESVIAVLRIESQPSGAEVWIDGKQLGQTPIAIENNYRPQDYEVLVRKKGFQPWKAVFFGGISTRLDARLGRQR
jgi:hypothetical protein